MSGFVYFIRDAAAGLVKIGHAGNPWRRLYQIQVHNAAPLEIVAIEQGGEKRESELHVRFSSSHVRGEWFRFDGDVQAYAAALGVPEKPLRANDTTYFWGMPQTEVAQATGFSQGYLSNIQSGKRRASPDVAIVLQRLTGVSAISLVFGDLADEAA